ncbi:MAG: LON peptidase substrate-binding domain-containing protein [Myxococcota bacterium]
MEPARLQEICDALPIFPLPRTVLLPGASLPLHVFEARYRALVAHCLATDRLIGIATLKPGYEPQYEDAPAVWPEVGIGELVAHQPFPDGRCNIVLQYVGRARIREEIPSDHPFRMVRGAVGAEDDRGTAGALAALKVLVLQLGGLSASAANEARRLVQLEGMELVDALARRLVEDPDEQRRYLGVDRLSDRIAIVQDRLATFLVPSNGASTGDS